MGELSSKVLALERKINELQRELSNTRTDALDAQRVAERRVAEAEHRGQVLSEENHALLLELESRPTLQENRSLKREIDILERRLMELKGNSRGVAGVGAGAEGGELVLAMEGVGRAPLTGRERMRRDRELHRLKLHAVADMPRDVLADLLQDACIELDISDATSLPATVRKLMRVMAAAPRMETFIADICQLVFQQGASWVPPQLQGSTDPSIIPAILGTWMSGLSEGETMRDVLTAVAEAMQQRVDPATRSVSSPAELLAAVRSLVMVEATAMTARESLVAAEGVLSATPDAPLCQAVRHFQQLFGCPKFEGVVTAMNKVYMTSTEQRNMIRDLADSLGLPPETGCNMVMQRLRSVLQSPQYSGPANGTGGPANSAHAPAAATIASSASVAHSGPASVEALGAEVADILKRLQAVFAVHSYQQLVGAAEKLVGRLRKLDDVLPRYQRVASQLYEMLRVRTLEEVVPALRDLLSSFHD